MMRALAVWWWQRIPASVARVWLTLGLALSDGSRLRRWPTIAATVPVVGMLLGLVLGAVHPGPLYTYSFATVVLLIASTTGGAGVGWWTWLGFAVTDLLVINHSSLPGFSHAATLTDRITDGYLPLLLVYLILAFLLVFMPLTAVGFAAWAAAVLRRGPHQLAAGVGYLVYVAVAAGVTFAWAQATPFLIRPVWSFAGDVPDIAGIQPVQGNAAVLAGVAAVAAAVRCGWTTAAAGRLDPPRLPALDIARPVRKARAVGVVAAALQALILTLLLGGLVSGLVVGFVVWLLLWTLLVARFLIVPRLPGWPQLIRRVPVVVRIAVCVLVAYLLGTWFVQPQVQQGETSFMSLVAVLLVSLAVSSLLLPGIPPRRGSDGIPRPGPAPSDGSPSQLRRGTGQPEHPNRARFDWRQWTVRLGGFVALTCGLVLIPARPAAADNCSGLSDCSFGVKIALAIAAIALVALLIFLLPELLGVEEAAVEAEAATEGGTAVEEVAEAAAEGAEEASAEGAGEAAAEGGAEDEAAAQAEAEQQRLQELAKDPDHGGKITPGSMQEARAARGLEQSGDLPGPVERAPSGGADFIDGTGQEWDVKGFRSDFPPGRGGYDFATSMEKIGNELGQGENVILDRTNLTEAAVSELKAAIDAAGWSGKVLWWPPL